MRKKYLWLCLSYFTGLISCRSHEEHGISLGDQTMYVNNSGGPQRVALPDGSHVSIKSGTKIVLGRGFGTDNRDLDFDGEGMFEVDAVGAKRFVVHTGNLVIEVVDSLTQGVVLFRVDAVRKRVGEEVNLLEGRLKVSKSYPSDTDNEPEVLQAGEMLMINKEIDLMEKEKMSPAELDKVRGK
jgi:ferric-dicitrate binding protein FerR (iron transport regulator)